MGNTQDWFDVNAPHHAFKHCNPITIGTVLGCNAAQCLHLSRILTLIPYLFSYSFCIARSNGQTSILHQFEKLNFFCLYFGRVRVKWTTLLIRVLLCSTTIFQSVIAYIDPPVLPSMNMSRYVALLGDNYERQISIYSTVLSDKFFLINTVVYPMPMADIMVITLFISC